ncbi:hypothetical protein [Yersinia intermedia]|uniref:hypothetical protein n=1 Tax=Yersinia intermedia TaxID=631 RepID=UPI0011A30BD7|nr:hypothetical protein [Yersinia intermedia]
MERAQKRTNAIELEVQVMNGISSKGWTGAQRMIPITAVYQKWDSIDMTVAVSTWSLFVKDISMDENDVTATIALKNPMVNNVGKLYNTTDFPGLINI